MGQDFGFSTGALERGNYLAALDWMRGQKMRSVELSALRFDELEPLVKSLDQLPLDGFHYVSFHAPSSFAESQEIRVLELLQPVYQRGWNIVVHPDVIYTAARWRCFGASLLVENMDRRKPIGRTADELSALFHHLPDARLCLDVAHARQQDTTMTLLHSIVACFADRIAEVHISELDSYCQHHPMSDTAACAYRRFAPSLRRCPHVIIESMLETGRAHLRMKEWQLARKVMTSEDPACTHTTAVRD